MMGKQAMLGCAALLIAGIAAAPAVVADTPLPGRGIQLQKTDSGELRIQRLVVETPAQWQQWLASPALADSPFSRLDPQRRQAFSRSLEFRNGALADYSHRVLLQSFAAADAYQVLGIFGLEHELAFLPGVRVESAADRCALAAAAAALEAGQSPFAQIAPQPAMARGDARPGQRWQPD